MPLQTAGEAEIVEMLMPKPRQVGGARTDIGWFHIDMDFNDSTNFANKKPYPKNQTSGNANNESLLAPDQTTTLGNVFYATQLFAGDGNTLETFRLRWERNDTGGGFDQVFPISIRERINDFAKTAPDDPLINITFRIRRK